MNLFSKIIEKQKNPEQFKNKMYLKKIQQLQHLQQAVELKSEYHFKHSGNAGDIIYSIPAMLGIAKGKPIHIHLQVNQKGHYGKNPHPLGGVMLNEKTVELLKPLLLAQPNIVSCDIYSNQNIDIDLDLFRSYPFLLDRGNIARWYFLIFGEFFELENGWLRVTANPKYSDAIVIARSQRYHAPGISYNFLQKYQPIYFIGVEQEYEEMKQMIPSIIFKPVNNFLEMAEIIAGCKLFIGNQSFPFSLAEAMKAYRLLEWYFQTPNVSITGKNGFDFCLQHNFEKLVGRRMLQ